MSAVQPVTQVSLGVGAPVDATWERYLRSRFPAYLLPSARHSEISRAEAERFLERIIRRKGDLELLRAAAVLSSSIDLLLDFTDRALPALLEVLPSKTEVHRRLWNGGFYGSLDLAATLTRRRAGDGTSFVTRQPRRTSDRPENVLVRVVSERIIHLLARLREQGILSETGWSAPAAAAEGRLRQLFQHSRLRQIPSERIQGEHVHAAQHATHPSYQAALKWYELLRDGLDTDDPRRISKILQAGALSACDAATRFELAVLIRLIESVNERTPGGELDMGLIHSRRQDVATLRVPNGRQVRFYHNQTAGLAAGPRDRGVSHYFDTSGRYRPDIVLTITEPHASEPQQAVVFEVKHTQQQGYQITGYEEAWAYRWEYQRYLKGWPKSVLVSSGSIPGVHRPGDEVIAVPWKRWVPRDVVEAIVAMVECGSSPC